MAPIADTPLSGSDPNMEKSAEETGSPSLGAPRSPSQLEQQSDLADLERLGRERPACFSSIWSELTFAFSIVMSQILAEYYISGSNVLVPTLVKELHIPEASVVWPSTALSLVVTSTLLIFGRLGDMYGGYVVYLAGAGWLAASSILAGFSQTWLMLIICRALQGFALAAFLPSGIMILGSTYRPGPRKNLIFSVYGACAALGFFAGIFFSGLCSQFLSWRWYFFIGAILSAVTFISSYFSVPSDFAERKKANVKMDWAGCCLSVPGAVLLVFSIAESSYAPQGWKTPYIPVCFSLGVIFLGLMVYVEGWVVKDPLLPGDLFAVKYLTPLVIALLCLYGSLGIYFLYAVLYMSDVMGAGPLQIVAWTVPMAVGGLILATAGGFIMHKVSGTLLMVISCIGYAGAGLFFAVIPEGGIYWGFVFPAMICGTVGIDISFNISNIFITTHMPKAKQGLAGALINCTLHFGIAIFLGFADIVKSETEHLGQFKSFKAVFWYETALALVGGLIVVFFVRIHHAKSDLTVEEREALTAESRNT
ncbi:major facilitator superfamily domain-containing protein [Aspergillus caelatus]|uniref:Major facilitator superfamily domain-containing protein n=2 Tax=Aspergillus subgen. Circumdati TaxID=2720871 RepID=A0A5N7AKG7_9EURO|nr:major facilitator superfamily domain-containing protein [Aspergillus caelatus]KAE8370382.1 major facilitator superfamily domain-containing protein [Aspergillus caelatus]KAE8422918.1 major facilitator superfamily domain-containing protein [Aspergillus pseudocaelatus]